MNSRLSPAEAFPEDLSCLADIDLQVLHSRVQRQLDHEYVHDFEPHPETQFRGEEIAEEFERRETQAALWGPLLQTLSPGKHS